VSPKLPGTDPRRAGLASTAAAAAALLEEGDRRHAGVPEDARDLLLDEIQPDLSQPRRTFDETELRSLADDISRRGVISAILVRPPSEPGGKYLLVCGERRWRASRIAGAVRIPARVRNLSEEEARAAQLAENVLRSDLNDVEKGRSLRQLYEIRKATSPRATWEDIAQEVGLGRARIHDLFHLASLPESVAALIEAERLSGSHGIALQRAQVPLGDERIIELAHQAARPEERRSGSYGLSVVLLREKIQALLRGDVSTVPEPVLPARAFVRRTVEAIQSGKLSEVERQALLSALQPPMVEEEP
jgi:ParB family transcriptional regulator, chromosome partitioning protein